MAPRSPHATSRFAIHTIWPALSGSVLSSGSTKSITVSQESFVTLGVGEWGGVRSTALLRAVVDKVRNVVGGDHASMRAIG